MAVSRYRCDRFSLEPIERRLFTGEVLVEPNSGFNGCAWSALLMLVRR
jgi:hypothetical protein